MGKHRLPERGLRKLFSRGEPTKRTVIESAKWELAWQPNTDDVPDESMLVSDDEWTPPDPARRDPYRPSSTLE